MPEKREIKSHKGGRTERIYARLTPEEKERLQAILKREKRSLSDWIMEMVIVGEQSYKQFTNECESHTIDTGG